MICEYLTAIIKQARFAEVPIEKIRLSAAAFENLTISPDLAKARRFYSPMKKDGDELFLLFRGVPCQIDLKLDEGGFEVDYEI